LHASSYPYRKPPSTKLFSSVAALTRTAYGSASDIGCIDNRVFGDVEQDLNVDVTYGDGTAATGIGGDVVQCWCAAV